MSFSYNPQAGTLPAPGFSKPPASLNIRRGPFLILFVILILLAIPAIWLFIPVLSLQLTGQQTTGKAYTVQDCGTDSDGTDTWQTTVLFLDNRGQMFEIPPNGACDDYLQDGGVPTVWYSADQPTHTFVLSGLSIFLYIYMAVWLLASAICLFFFLRILVKLIRASLQAKTALPLLGFAALCLVALAPLLGAMVLIPPEHIDGPTRDYHLGETVSVDGRWAMTVQSAQAGTLRAPADGDLCLALKITLRNSTDQTLSFDTTQLTLYDPQINPITTTCSDAPSTLSSVDNVAPGEAITGTLISLVPLSTSPVYLAFQPDQQHALNTARSFWMMQVTQAGPQ